MTQIKPLLYAPLLAAGIAGSTMSAAQTKSTAPASAQTAGAANAQATAAAIEACIGKSQAMLASLDKHDYAGAEKDFNDTMRAALTPDKLQQVWDALPAQYGKPGPRGAPHNSTSGTYSIVTVPMQFEKNTLAARIACDAGGKVAGFHLLALPSPQPAAAATAAAPAPAPAHS